MKLEIINFLRCPETGQRLTIENGSDDSGEGFLLTEDRLRRYPIVNGIPRFVSSSNYSINFGIQWNRFRQTQLDSYTGTSISSDRFWKSTNWLETNLNDQWVLDVGCGSGRFAEIALKAGANVVAVDHSSAVDACYENLRHYPNFHILQGDIYKLPLAPNSFGFVYSLGVLQHTPDVHKAFIALTRMPCEGGSLCVDYYWRRLRTILHSKYIFRPLTKRIDKSRLFSILECVTPKLLLASKFLGAIPYIGFALKRIIPVADYTNIFPLTDKQIREWALLDTYDMLSPEYDNPQSAKTVRRWFNEANFQDVEVGHFGHLVARGIKPKVTKKD